MYPPCNNPSPTGPFVCGEQRLGEAERFTRRLARSHYENFIVGGLLTPRRLRQDFYNVYAYCRMADDMADEIHDPAESLRRLDQWQAGLEACYEPPAPSGAGTHPVFVALRPTIERFQIPRQPFLALLSAFRQDQRVGRYQTFDEVLDYCQRSANPVGHLVLYLAECFDPHRARLADEICTGLQLANFCQDVRRDAARGRVYLPAEDLDRFGVDPGSLAQRQVDAVARELLRFEVGRAEAFFHRGLPLLHQVPPWLARDVRLFAGGGLATLQAVRRRGYDVWRRRPTVSRWTQMRLMLQVWLGAPRGPLNGG